jgi:hypothetical protein
MEFYNNFHLRHKNTERGADFEEDLLLDHVPIIGGRVSASNVDPAPLLTVHGTVADPTTSSHACVQGGLYVGHQVEEGRQSEGATRSPRGAPDAGSSAATLCELHAGYFVPANTEVIFVTKVCLDEENFISLDYFQTNDNNLHNMNA